MEVLTGVLLVFVTWSACIFGIATLGLLAAALTQPRASRITLLRRALWWGLLIAVIEVCALSLFVPMHSPAAASVLSFSCVVLGVPGWLMWRKRASSQMSLGRSKFAIILALAIAQVYWAVAALGPVTGYDAGLYHLGAIRYASDFAAVPGLSNLYGPLGYATAEFPLGAVLGNGPWGVEGFRLLNGLILALVACELLIRTTRKRLSAGTYVLIVGCVAAWIPMIALSDFWVTSPSQDSAVLALSLVSISYFVDAIAKRKNFQENLIIAVVIAIVIVMLRSTMFGFFAAMLAVSLILISRRTGWTRSSLQTRGMLLVSCLAALGAFTMVARDYLLSGWLQYPLSIFSFDVAWLAPDPTGLREATLGFARDPENTWESVSGWAWVPAWFSRLPKEWAFAEFVTLSLAALVLLIISRRLISSSRQWRALCAAMVPSSVAVALWWLASPPAFRFAWGPLFTLAAIPLGWSLWTLSRSTARTRHYWTRSACIVAGCLILGVTGFSAASRQDWGSITATRQWKLVVSIPYSVAPITEPSVITVNLASGLTIAQPTNTDQCWNIYPLCTPVPASGLALRDGSINQGFSSDLVKNTN